MAPKKRKANGGSSEASSAHSKDDLVFYYAPYSTADITKVVLHALDIPHVVHQVDLQNDGTKTEEFIKLNPNKKVPVIVHKGTTIYESAAIAIYLGETFGVDKGLFPEASPERGRAMTILVWAAVNLAAAALAIIEAKEDSDKNNPKRLPNDLK